MRQFRAILQLAQNCLTSMLDYIVIQMRKLNCEKGYLNKNQASCVYNAVCHPEQTRKAIKSSPHLPYIQQRALAMTTGTAG